MRDGQVQMTGDELRGVRAAVEVFHLISVSLDLNQTLNAVLDGLKSLIDYDAARIDAIAPGTNELRGCIMRGYPNDAGECGPSAPSQGIVGSVLETGQP